MNQADKLVAATIQAMRNLAHGDEEVPKFTDIGGTITPEEAELLPDKITFIPGEDPTQDEIILEDKNTDNQFMQTIEMKLEELLTLIKNHNVKVENRLHRNNNQKNLKVTKR